MGLLKTASGILLPKKKEIPVICEYCGNVIWQHNEAKGRLWLVKGKPACAVCRVKKFGVFSKAIKSDKKNYVKDLKAKEIHAQQYANEQAIEVALASQTKTDTNEAEKRRN
jgi:hypothetical protein